MCTHRRNIQKPTYEWVLGQLYSMAHYTFHDLQQT
jgi:hypothetical protein